MTNYQDLVARGVELRLSLDGNRWDLGDLAVDFLAAYPTPAPGRPADDDDSPTLGDFAHAINLERRALNNYYLVSAFYPDEHRPANCAAFSNLTWTHFNRARRASGGDLDNALELLHSADRLALGVRAFDRYCNGDWYEGPVAVHELPAHLRSFAPNGATQAWVVMRAVKDGQ